MNVVFKTVWAYLCPVNVSQHSADHKASLTQHNLRSSTFQDVQYFPFFLSHNVNVNIIVCSCSFFLLQIPNILMLITAGRILTMSMSPTLHQCWCLRQPDLASVNAFHCAGSKNCKMSSTPQLTLFVPWPPILSDTLTQVLLRNTVTAKENVTGPFLNCQIPVFQRPAFL